MAISLAIVCSAWMIGQGPGLLSSATATTSTNKSSTLGAFAHAITTPAAVTTNSGKASTSSPIAVSPDNRFVWSVNPDADTVSVFNVERDANRKIAEIRVGKEPNNLAISPDGQYVYVACTVSGHIAVVSTRRLRVAYHIKAGTEPYGLALTPNGHRLYVANARSNDVSVIDTNWGQEIRRINVGDEPRGIAITNDGDFDDSDEKVYVADFLAVDRPGVLIGRDDYKEGVVRVISTGNNRVIKTIKLAPVADTGFRSNGGALARIPATNPATFTVTTGAFPNMLNSIVIRGNRAYLPNNAASPDGPVRFNVNVQAFLSIIDTHHDAEGEVNGQRQGINLNSGVQFEPTGPNRLFFAVPWHVAFENFSNEGWVVSLSSNLIVKVTLDQNGTPSNNAPRQAGGAGNVVRIKVGQNPRGIAINEHDTRAYVMNEVSRDISVIDLRGERLLTNIQSSNLPHPNSQEARTLIGKAIFNSSTGVDLPELGPNGVIGDRLSSEGWSSCFACHAFGHTDGVVWIFGTGPRRAIPLNGTFNPRNPHDQKILNYSAIFDEVQDFENNIRGVSGGLGLITLPDGTQDPTLNAFNPANTGRSATLDLLSEYVARGIRTPISPLSRVPWNSHKGRELALGRHVFQEMGCAKCHGGAGWSVSRRDYTPPPAASELLAENGANQLFRFLRKVGTFDPAATNEIRQNGVAALGKEGFNPPSLLGAWAMGPLLHNGSALRIEDTIDNLTHRRAGLAQGRVDILEHQHNRVALGEFLKSIDASTHPFPIQ
ncbi:MAG: YncE family protein [Blastocatellia bacterium]